METDILKILSEELRETRSMVIETRRMADAAQRSAEASGRKADAAWELVIMTRNQIMEDLRYMKLPWWKKLTGKVA